MTRDDLLLTHATAYTPGERVEDAWVSARAGKIAALGQGVPPAAVAAGARVIDAHGKTLAPGFVDLHVHGGGGADFMDATPEALQTIARTHAAGGTTAWVGTTVTASLDITRRAVAAAAPLVNRPLDGATLIGAHLEGPYLSLEQIGAHWPGYTLVPRPVDYEALFDQLPGIGRVTAAPELSGALAMGEAMRRRGIHAAIGHSNAYLPVIREAVAAGYSHVTHLYCCTSGLRNQGGYKQLGINEASLLLDELTVEIIGDGYHVPGDLIQLVLKVKGVERVCLVTDAMRAAGLGPGNYLLGDLEVVVEDGVAKLPDRSKFAGSVCTMAQAVRTAMGAGIPLEHALAMAGETPATLIGLADRKGRLCPGYDADLVLLDAGLHVTTTIVGGRVVYGTA
ncbi:MAG TPA: N-acetylglucosamine-6-phosphate deacetylase [Chloroflexota bacterium]|nr:N-acetylglucosamine-6-phosphate deacetylase [Chloroflexota bacterium]